MANLGMLLWVQSEAENQQKRCFSINAFSFPCWFMIVIYVWNRLPDYSKMCAKTPSIQWLWINFYWYFCLWTLYVCSCLIEAKENLFSTQLDFRSPVKTCSIYIQMCDLWFKSSQKSKVKKQNKQRQRALPVQAEFMGQHPPVITSGLWCV